ncbi:hypothetical protein RR48_08101 [Papilio machaon]|uniref:Integrase catalytic domain-containing protein n=1 Tax=Papilio machaon TaxID=76193 RepID=A0A194RGQ8_PAPMA|nr:hypothetical protein RR48_08101 [Papilio machaon]
MPESESYGLKELLKKRSTIKGRLTKFKEYLTVLSQIKPVDLTTLQIKEVTLRLAKFQELFSSFDNLQSQIELLSVDDDEQLKERDLLENQFYSSISTAQDILDAIPVTKERFDGSMASAVSGSCSHAINTVKLPTIKLPTFDGNYLKWLEFRDTFDSLINSNDSIPTINKFHYLRSALEGSATVVIKSIEFTTANYKVAWDLLCERYNNKNILINNHLKALYHIEPITRESFKALRYLIDQVSKNLRALGTLGLPTEQWDVLVVFMMSSKLDVTTNRKWEEHKNSLTTLPTLNDFNTFLRNRADVLETTQSTRCDRPDNKSHFKSQHSSKSLVAASTSTVAQKRICSICKNDHRVYLCPTFLEMSLKERQDKTDKLKLCANCLREGHNVNRCRLKGCCRSCKGKHNSLLHIEQENVLTSAPVSLAVSSTKQVLLCTAVVDIVNPQNNVCKPARILLDTGSQSCFITNALKNKLDLSINKINSVNVSGINNIGFNISERCHIQLNSRVSSFTTELDCLVVPNITGTVPSKEIKLHNLKLPLNITLADPEFYEPSEIDILIGADVFWDIIGSQQIKLGPCLPTLQDSKLGWLISGPVGVACSKGKVICNFTQSDLHETMKKFWEVEELPASSKNNSLSLEEQLCETHFVQNTTRLSSGRFSVKMPFKESPEHSLGESFYSARGRFFNLEKKLYKNERTKKHYSDFIKEYQDLGHLSEIERLRFGFYLPHHAVIREQSETSKLRVVFDASAKSSSGKSLNDLQLVGPVVQSDLFSILLRFRIHKFVLTGDIEKMYRQVEIDASQRHLQLILWRESDEQPLKTLQLNTVTYGTASAPFLATRCLLQLAHECQDETIANVLKRDFYVDDLNTGSNTIQELRRIYNGVNDTLKSACFPLRKFRTNCPELFNSKDNVCEVRDWNKESTVLGLNWSPKSDMLFFCANMKVQDIVTKRIVTSMTCRIFDPLGLLSACIIKCKIFLQQLWINKIGWDDPIPSDDSRKWSDFMRSLSRLSSIKIPRHVIQFVECEIDLHCFVDAAQHAYGATVYLRAIDKEGQIHIQLLCAKARVTPLKALTIPRLELCGALLGARLCDKVLESLPCNIRSKTIWTDSTIVLGWLRTQSRNLKTFVMNRVNEINELTQGFTWMHVPTDQNPADLASRGVDPQQLQDSTLWWRGPSFLLKEESEWPKQSSISINNLPELKVFTVNEGKIDTKGCSLIDFNKYSRFDKLKRIVAYILRFINKCRKTAIQKTGAPDIEELDKSLNLLVRQAQFESFATEINNISNNKKLNHKSRLLSLDPFVDSEGILRVGGRLQNSNFNFDKKHPILLDGKHHLSLLLMRHEHIRLFHAGPQLLLAAVREEFWPIGGRNLARNVTRKCVICTRMRGSVIKPIMGTLPAARVSPSFVFEACGVDFAGPFAISSKKGRGNNITKCFLALFVCLQTKALHLETVSSMSTDAFLLCLRRFVSRRGKPHVIYCDNGTNFVGAKNELGRVIRASRQSVSDYANNEKIKFVFSPAYAPHFGGIWEAGIKSAKGHLKRVIGNASLTFEELATLFAQIEAILNSRPLTPLSSDPSDLYPLTPGHFLIGRPLVSVPSLPVTSTRPNRYEAIEKMRQHFWDRWRKEFIAELQERTKWKTRQQDLAVGDMVVLKEDNLPPLLWRLGRVLQLFTGPDGVNRVADIKTSRGTIRRAFNKICLLPKMQD